MYDRRVRLEILQIVRGNVRPTDFWLTYRGFTSCGPIGAMDVVDGEVGDVFVIYARLGRLSSQTVLQGYSATTATTWESQQILRGERPREF